MNQIELSLVPQELQDVVNAFLSEHKSSAIIACTSHDSMPYTDKSIVSTSFRVYVEWGNLFTLFHAFVDSNEPGKTFIFSEKKGDSMIVADIETIMNTSRWFRHDMDPLAHIMTPVQASEKWGLSEKYIENLCREEKIRARKLGKQWVIDARQDNPKQNNIER